MNVFSSAMNPLANTLCVVLGPLADGCRLSDGQGETGRQAHRWEVRFTLYVLAGVGVLLLRG